MGRAGAGRAKAKRTLIMREMNRMRTRTWKAMAPRRTGQGAVLLRRRARDHRPDHDLRTNAPKGKMLQMSEGGRRGEDPWRRYWA
jgi:hypothetical protein